MFDPSSFQRAYNIFLDIPEDEVCQVGNKFKIPIFPEKSLLQLCEAVIEVLKSQPQVLRLSSDTYIIGDLHGNFRDLLRVFCLATRPQDGQFLFLGDYVDRGEFSLDVIVLLFYLVVQYPDRVFLLRGNHEIPEINFRYGFFEHIEFLYGQKSPLYDAFNEVFDYLSLCAIIDGQVFCVHGGLCPNLQNIDDVDEIQKPICGITFNSIHPILWSDPVDTKTTFTVNMRGCGFYFGEPATISFLHLNSFHFLVRSHECIKTGVRFSQMKKTITVFSTSDYAHSGNKAGILHFVNGKFSQITFNPLDTPLNRDLSNYFNYVDKRIPLTFSSSILNRNPFTHSQFRVPGPSASYRKRRRIITSTSLCSAGTNAPYFI